jgi:hypothetical protein
MNNKYLIAWVMPLLLLGSSCKKQEKLGQDNHEKQIQKSDLIGTWTIVKTENTGLTKKGLTTVIDSSENLKLYISDYKFSNSEIQVEKIKSKYEIKNIDDQSFLAFKSFGEEYNFKISNVRKLLKIEMIESSLNPNRITIHYYKKINNEAL